MVGCLLAQTSIQTNLPLSSLCRYFCDAVGAGHVCTRVTMDTSQQKCCLTQGLSLAPNSAAALSFELIQWMSREPELSQNYHEEMYLRNCNLFGLVGKKHWQIQKSNQGVPSPETNASLIAFFEKLQFVVCGKNWSVTAVHLYSAEFSVRQKLRFLLSWKMYQPNV